MPAYALTIFHKADGSVDRVRIATVVATLLLPIIIIQVNESMHDSVITKRTNHRGRPKGTCTIKRNRRDVQILFSELSDYGFRHM